MRYVTARFNNEQRELAYRIYVTDSLQLIPQNSYRTQRFYDLTEKEVDNRTGDEIALDVIKKAGLKLKSEVK